MSFGKYVKTSPAGSEEELAYKSIQALVLKFNALLAKLDADAVGGADYVTVIKPGVDPDALLIQSPKKQSV
jgi:hypothetical protein